MTPESMIDALTQTGQSFRRQGVETRRALFIDVETTGLDPSIDELIELAMVSFTYAPDGRIYEIGEPLRQLRQPSNPISPEITAITGITNEMVAGQWLDPEAVARFADGAAPIVAHNAGFDRKFVEELIPAFVSKLGVLHEPGQLGGRGVRRNAARLPDNGGWPVLRSPSSGGGLPRRHNAAHHHATEKRHAGVLAIA